MKSVWNLVVSFTTNVNPSSDLLKKEKTVRTPSKTIIRTTTAKKGTSAANVVITTENVTVNVPASDARIATVDQLESFAKEDRSGWIHFLLCRAISSLLVLGAIDLVWLHESLHGDVLKGRSRNLSQVELDNFMKLCKNTNGTSEWIAYVDYVLNSTQDVRLVKILRLHIAGKCKSCRRASCCYCSYHH